MERFRKTADPKYGSDLLGRFINAVMKAGKKSLAERIVYGAFDIIQEKLSKDPLEVFQDAIKNVKPLVEIKSRRVGGDTYQIPISVEEKRSETVAFRWLIDAARKRKGKGFSEVLSAELIDAYNKTGSAMERREATHRMAEANKAFAHFA